MQRRQHFVIGSVVALAGLFLLVSCGSRSGGPGPESPPPDLPDGLAGMWTSEAFGIQLKLDATGEFSWDQENLHKEGWFQVQGGWLVMTVKGNYQTRYTLQSISAERLVLEDPAGTAVTFTRDSSGADETPAGPAVEAAGLEAVQGVWSNTKFQLRIELAAEGTFVWKQGSLVETGLYTLDEGAVRMTTGGHTSTYRIVKLGEKVLVLLDPAGNELSLERVGTETPPEAGAAMGKDSLLGGKPTIKIVGLEKDTGSPAASYLLEPLPAGQQTTHGEESVVGAGGLFSYTYPDGFKVDTQKVCGNKFTSQGKVYTCWNRNDLYAPDSSRMHFDLASFVTWAAPGALDELSPDIDGLLAGFDEDRISVSDEIWEISGFEVFSTRISGRSGGTGKQMSGRILGVHYGDLLVVGVLALSGDPSSFSQWGEEVEQILDSLSFYIVEGEQTASSLAGTWKSDDGTTISLKADGTFSRDGAQGTWIALGSTLVMATGPAMQGVIEAHPVVVEGNMLNLGGSFYEKSIQ